MKEMLHSGHFGIKPQALYSRRKTFTLHDPDCHLYYYYTVLLMYNAPYDTVLQCYRCRTLLMTTTPPRT